MLTRGSAAQLGAIGLLGAAWTAPKVWQGGKARRVQLAGERQADRDTETLFRG